MGTYASMYSSTTTPTSASAPVIVAADALKLFREVRRDVAGARRAAADKVAEALLAAESAAAAASAAASELESALQSAASTAVGIEQQQQQQQQRLPAAAPSSSSSSSSSSQDAKQRFDAEASDDSDGDLYPVMVDGEDRVPRPKADVVGTPRRSSGRKEEKRK